MLARRLRRDKRGSNLLRDEVLNLAAGRVKE
jgi:hypothetical protein